MSDDYESTADRKLWVDVGKPHITELDGVAEYPLNLKNYAESSIYYPLHRLIQITPLIHTIVPTAAMDVRLLLHMKDEARTNLFGSGRCTQMVMMYCCYPTYVAILA